MAFLGYPRGHRIDPETGGAGFTGMSTIIVVPCPAELSTVIVPPSNLALSRMLTKPNPASLDG